MNKARVFKHRWGWYWAHACAPGWDAGSGFPYLRHQDSLVAALKHLRECA